MRVTLRMPSNELRDTLSVLSDVSPNRLGGSDELNRLEDASRCVSRESSPNHTGSAERSAFRLRSIVETSPQPSSPTALLITGTVPVKARFDTLMPTKLLLPLHIAPRGGVMQSAEQRGVLPPSMHCPVHWLVGDVPVTQPGEQ